MKACIFLGPSLSRDLVPATIDVLSPAAMGSVHQAVLLDYRLMGIVDGVFGNVPSVWHKEILFAIAQGVVVGGAGSMGAIRASELCQYGMIGLGRVYRLYQWGSLSDDDEVCLMHGPEELDYAPASEPMINVRFTARRLRRARLLSASEETAFVREAKGVFFASRTRRAVLTILRGCVSRELGDVVSTAFCDAYYDVKAADALCLVNWMKGGVQARATEPAWSLVEPHHSMEHLCKTDADLLSLPE